MARLWDRTKSLDLLVLSYTVGDDHILDRRLVPYDLRASAAHAAMLFERGYLSAEDHHSLEVALREIGAGFSRGEWSIDLDEEDCHTAIENRLVACVGEAGKRIHLGRSRNDQVLAALRLWMLDAVADLSSSAEAVAGELTELTRREGFHPMPGYTHTQRAMPSSTVDWAGGFAAELLDDAEGLRSVRRRISKNPLGSGAGFGTPGIKIDRRSTTASLEFDAIHEPVTAVQLSRGKAEAELVFQAALLAQDLGRIAADLVLFASAEFAFVKLDESITTGSSIMPQKRNPDVFELMRGKTSEAWAALQEIVGVTSKMTSGYHRDMQLLKKPLMRAVDSVIASAAVMAHALRHVHFIPQNLLAAMDPGLFAAERANRLVAEEGLPFREAYRRVKDELMKECDRDDGGT